MCDDGVMRTVILALLTLVAVALACRSALAQDISPLKGRLVWLPMTGYSEADLDDARAAGYDTAMLKIAPPMNAAGEVDFAAPNAFVKQASDRGMKVVFAIVGWAALGQDFWDTETGGKKLMGRLDPFWPEAMERVETYFRAVLRRYAGNPDVIAFAPTWGIYGEAGFVSFEAGRSEHALARFNEWRKQGGLAPVETLPDLTAGLNTDYNRFIRFRYVYLEEAFSAMLRRLKGAAGGKPVGMWQEMYPVMGYLWTMTEQPEADFALGEASFPFQTLHRTESSLTETMGFRYRCGDWRGYAKYALPILARKRGGGQGFMGCQLTNGYAVNSFGWTQQRAERVEFNRWEDHFAPTLKKLLDEPLEPAERDVLFVCPTYAAAALPLHPRNSVDAILLDVEMRRFGCQMRRIGSPRLDQLAVEEMDAYRLIVIPDAAYLLSETLDRLTRTKATVLFTGAFGQALDAEQARAGSTRTVDGAALRYGEHPEGDVSVAAESDLTRGMNELLAKLPVRLSGDEGFDYADARQASVQMRCGGRTLVSTRRGGRFIFFHGHPLASACLNPERKPPRNVSGSADSSANETDLFGPYDSAHPQNAFGTALMRNVLDSAGVQYRVPEPKPRTVTRYLGDHMEQASINANIVYNNTGRSQTVDVRTPWRPDGYPCQPDGRGYRTRVTVAPYGYVALSGF